MKAFLRIECDDGEGAYSSLAFSIASNSFESSHITPEQETKEFKKAFGKLGSEALFGFKDAAALLEWVTPEFLSVLKQEMACGEKFLIKFYAVNERFDGARQSICHKNELVNPRAAIDLFDCHNGKLQEIADLWLTNW